MADSKDEEESDQQMARVQPSKPFTTHKRDRMSRLALLRKVAERGGIRHVLGGTLKLNVPREG